MASGNKPAREPTRRQLPRCKMSNYKVKFKTRQAAEDEMRYQRALHELSGGKLPVRSYKCDHCHKWHLTAMEKHG